MATNRTINKITLLFLMRSVLSAFLFLSVFHTASSQSSLRASEQKLTVLFDSLDGYHGYDPDFLDYQDSLIKDILISALNDSTSFSYPFDSLVPRVSIAEAPDHQLRFFSWNTLSGGTMADIASLVQYRGVDGSVHARSAKPGGINNSAGRPGEVTIDQAISFDRVFSVKDHHYIALGYGKYSSKDGCQTMCNFEIKDNILIDTNQIFMLDSKLSATISSCFVFIVPVPAKTMMRYDSLQKKIRYTEVAYDDIKKKNVCIRKIDLYFDGHIFRRKIMK